MKSSLPKKFMSLREKNSTHRRSKSSEPGHTRGNRSSDGVFSYFMMKSEAAKQANKEEKEEKSIEDNVNKVAKRIESLNYHTLPREHIRYVLLSRYADGDVEKAFEIIRIHQQAFSGIVVPYNPNVTMVGAENRGNVTCYLDALLFAMFAKLSAFECMLKNDFTTEAPRNLANLVRLWVNMLRSGKLILTDLNALAECGWTEARLLEQQDTSEAFAFITETLQLPLLTLQVDLFHQGNGDKDDHKVVYERLLNLAVPADPENKGIRLEDCLEDYFNTQVNVQRDKPEEKQEKQAQSSTASERESTRAEDTIRLVPVESPTKHMERISRVRSQDSDVQEERLDSDPSQLPSIQRRWTIMEPATQTLLDEDNASGASSSPRPSHGQYGRQRSASIIQRFVLEDGQSSSADSSAVMNQFKRKGSTVVKAVTIPAWQFFRLIPWHAASNNNEPTNNIDMARQLHQRPVVGICLKRYRMSDDRREFFRQNTYIDIPDCFRLPHFMMSDDGVPGEVCEAGETNDLISEYKLVLQSVVCHRGESLHSGHYISFARVNPKVLTENRRFDHDPPPDYEEEQWVCFDDLAQNRVSHVEDIRAALKAEMPYLLFYQIVPMVDLTPSTSEDNDVAEPPSYNDSTGHVDAQTETVTATVTETTDTTDTTEESEAADKVEERPERTPSNGGSSYVDASVRGSSTTGPSIRFSTELERPPRISFDEESNTSSIYRRPDGPSRRGSVVYTESDVTAQGSTPEAGRSPVMAAAIAPITEESTTQRLSRAASRWTSKSGGRSRPNSRPVSQAGEGRISLTMSRLGGLMRPSKDPLRQSEDGTGDSLTVLNGLHSAATTPGYVATDPMLSIPPQTLTTVVTAPAATPTAEVSQSSLFPSDAAAGTSERPSRRSEDHHRHHHHYHMYRGKSKSRDSKDLKDKDIEGLNIGDTTGNGGATSTTPSFVKDKGKEKEKAKSKMGVPERECSIM